MLNNFSAPQKNRRTINFLPIGAPSFHPSRSSFERSRPRNRRRSRKGEKKLRDIALSSALHLCLTFPLAKILKNLQQRLRIIAAKEVQKTSEVFARFRSFFLSLPCFSRIAERRRIWATEAAGEFLFLYCRSYFYSTRTEIQAKKQWHLP